MVRHLLWRTSAAVIEGAIEIRGNRPAGGGWCIARGIYRTISHLSGIAVRMAQTYVLLS